MIFIIFGIIFHFMTKEKENTLPRDYPEIEEIGTLHIVTNLDPVGYYVSGDSVAGYNRDLLRALQQYTPVSFKISLENSLDKSFEGLTNGKYDVIARNIPVNTELKKEYKFTDPIVYNKLVLVQRKAEFNEKKEPIRDHLQLGGITVHVPEDSPAILRLQNLSHEIGDTIFIKEDKTYESMQLVLMVAAGDIDYTVCDNQIAKKISAQIPELDVKTDIGFTHLEAWAVRKTSPQLLDSLNLWLSRYFNKK